MSDKLGTDISTSKLKELQQQHRSVERVKRDDKEELVFLVDVSGSMEERQKNGIIKLDQLQAALINFYVHRKTFCNCHLVSFSDKARWHGGSFIDAVMSLSPSGGTRLSNGFQATLGLVPKPQHIILLSDGQITQTEEELWPSAYALSAASVIMDCIGSGTNVNESLLKRLAAALGGSYSHVDDLGALSQKLLEVKIKGLLK